MSASGVGLALRALREEAGLSIEQAARAAACSPGQVEGIETGTRTAPASMLAGVLSEVYAARLAGVPA